MEEGWKQLKGPLIAISLALLASAWFWPMLPDLMPKHFNAAGVADGFIAKRWGVLIVPAFMSVFVFMPWIVVSLMRLGQLGTDQPDRREDARLGTMIATTVLVLLLAVHVVILLKASGTDLDMRRAMQAVIGLTLIPLGNIVAKLRRNAFVGIRTPWATADDEVWLHTQRFGGRAMMVAGSLVALLAAADVGHGALRQALIGVTVATMIFSWWTYRRLVLGVRPSP